MKADLKGKGIQYVAIIGWDNELIRSKFTGMPLKIITETLIVFLMLNLPILTRKDI